MEELGFVDKTTETQEVFVLRRSPRYDKIRMKAIERWQCVKGIGNRG